MEWKIDYLEEDGIVAAKVTGVMAWEQHKKFAEELYPFAHKHGSHRILIDFLEMTPKFTILQVDDLPGLLKGLGVGHRDRIAALHNPSEKALFETHPRRTTGKASFSKMWRVSSQSQSGTSPAKKRQSPG